MNKKQPEDGYSKTLMYFLFLKRKRLLMIEYTRSANLKLNT